jgi:hypothetical protein
MAVSTLVTTSRPNLSATQFCILYQLYTSSCIPLTVIFQYWNVKFTIRSKSASSGLWCVVQLGQYKYCYGFKYNTCQLEKTTKNAICNGRALVRWGRQYLLLCVGELHSVSVWFENSWYARYKSHIAIAFLCAVTDGWYSVVCIWSCR